MKSRDLLSLCFVCLICIGGCRTTGLEFTSDQFVAVKVTEEDSFSSLAEKHLKDPGKAWMIAEFNEKRDIKPGQNIVVPLHYFNKGGFRPGGYQVVPVLNFLNDSRRFSTEWLREFLRLIKFGDYKIIPVKELIDFVDYRIQIPEKSIVILFSGESDAFYKVVYPEFKTAAVPVTLFIDPEQVNKKGMLTSDQIMEMAQTGVSFQSCAGYNSMDPAGFTGGLEAYFAGVSKQIESGKKQIESLTKEPCELFLFPGGVTYNLVTSLLQYNGYTGAFTDKSTGNPFFADRYALGSFTIKKEISYDHAKTLLKTYQKLD